MYIKEIKINGYGNLKDKEIKFKDGLNIIYGKNESRKVNPGFIYKINVLWY